jgi:hypothetical protein
MHKGNPYIEALPPTPSREDLMKMLEVRLPYSDEDRLASGIQLPPKSAGP